MEMIEPKTRSALTVTELCARWGVARKTVVAMIHDRRLPAIRAGARAFRIPLIHVERIEREGDHGGLQG